PAPNCPVHKYSLPPKVLYARTARLSGSKGGRSHYRELRARDLSARSRLRMMWHEDQSSAFDAPGFELRQEVHSEHVHVAEAGRGDDPQVARHDVADAKFV